MGKNSSTSLFGDFDNCFVATACYGSDNAVVESLRIWRDKQTHWLIIWFIHLYYAGFGKIAGRILNVFPFLKPFARFFIWIFMILFQVKNERNENVCYHPLPKRRITHLGSHCDACGKRF